jgi:hypothetical protein
MLLCPGSPERETGGEDLAFVAQTVFGEMRQAGLQTTASLVFLSAFLRFSPTFRKLTPI